MATRKPRLFYGWVVVACAWAMYMLNQAAFTWGFTVFVDPLGKEFGWSRTSITLAWALSLGLGLVVSPWFGKALDRFGPRWTTAIGGILGGLLVGIPLGAELYFSRDENCRGDCPQYGARSN